MKKFLKRFFKSKLNILLIAVQLIMIVISYYNTYLEMKVLESQCNNPSVDFNIAFARELLEGYSGISFFANYILSTDFFIINTISCILLFNAIAGVTSYQHLKMGYGNFIATRESYSKYIKELIAAQWVYIVAWTFLFNFVVLMVSVLLFPVNDYSSITTDFGIEAIRVLVGLFVGQITVQSLYICLTTTIGQLSPTLIKNGIFVQIVPLIVYIVPQFLASTLGNLNEMLATFFMYFNSDSFLCSISSLYASDMSLWEGIGTIFALPVILLIIGVFSLKRNIGIFAEEYIL